MSGFGKAKSQHVTPFKSRDNVHVVLFPFSLTKRVLTVPEFGGRSRSILYIRSIAVRCFRRLNLSTTLIDSFSNLPKAITMTVEVLALRDVHTMLNYFNTSMDGQPPYNYAGDPPAGVPKTNIIEDSHPVIIHDARGKGDTLNLDNSGFQFVKYPSIEKDFIDEEKIKTVYYAEVEEILKKYTGGKRVFIFDHTIRRNTVAQGLRESKPGARGPAMFVHVDQTPTASEQRVKRHLGDDAECLLKGRYRLINVWRPIENTVAYHPLAVADYRSINPDADLIPSRIIFPDRLGEAYTVKYNPGHKWYYLSDQTPDEVILIKCFDSELDKARLTPHSAFYDSTSPKDAPHRQSIEVRALVFDLE